jgi:predicted DCC family thiol-disulfide oxidoreductase YuxK
MAHSIDLIRLRCQGTLRRWIRKIFGESSGFCIFSRGFSGDSFKGKTNRVIKCGMRPSDAKGVVFYDDACGFCRAWVPFWAETLQKRGLAIATLQSFEALRRLTISNEDLTRDLRLVTDDGIQKQGADVYRYVMKRIWWAFPFYLLFICPGTSLIFDRCYRAFADNRYRISSTCGLQRKWSRLDSSL